MTKTKCIKCGGKGRNCECFPVRKQCLCLSCNGTGFVGGKEKVPCDCPKGGVYSDGRTCNKCNGDEWVSPKLPKIEKLFLDVSDKTHGFTFHAGHTDQIESKINEIIDHLNQEEGKNE